MSGPTPLDPFRAPLAGPRLVDASAGTGKTHAIVSILLRLLLQGPGQDPAEALRIDQVLVVTFTRAATAELRERIRLRLYQALRTAEALADGRLDPAAPEPKEADKELVAWLREAPSAVRRQAAARLRAALADLDAAAIYTIHGLCQRLLQDYAFESGMDFDLDLATDASLLRRELLQDFWAQESYGLDAELLRGLMDQGGFKPDALEALAQAVTGQPWARRLPPADPAAAEACAQALDARRRAAGEVRAAWAAGGPQALEALAQAAEGGRVYRNIYPPEQVRGPWLRQASEALAREDGGGPASLAAATWFKWLSAERMATKTKQGKTPPEHPLFDACTDWQDAHLAWQHALAAQGLALRHRLADRLVEELPRRRRQARQLAFDDLIHRLDEALARPEGAGERLAARIRGRFRAALIDEFQDTDPVQDRIFSRLFQVPEAADLPFLRIGDPKQAIYRFRGADVFAYLAVLCDLPPASRFHLATNYRSDPALVALLNRLWQRAPRPFLFQEIEAAPVAAAHGQARPWPALRLAYLEPALLGRRDPQSGKLPAPNAPGSRRAASRAAAVAIQRLLREAPRLEAPDGSSRPVGAADIAVLVRSHAEARRLQRLLGAAGIPAALLSDASVLDQPEARDLEALLAALLQPGDAGLVRAALIAPPFALDAPGLEAKQADTAAWEMLLEGLREAQALWRRQGLLPAYRHLSGLAGGRARLLARRGGERSLANLDHLVELAHSVAFSLGLGPEALAAWLARARADSAYRDQAWQDLGLLRLERDSQAVKLMTMHRSKGLEFPFVFCPFLWCGVKTATEKTVAVAYHDLEGERAACLDIGVTTAAEARAAHDLEALADDLRLLYVALTRARHQVWLAWGPLAGSAQSALAYLLSAPELKEQAPGDDGQAALQAWRQAVVGKAQAACESAVKAANGEGEDRLWQQLEALRAELGEGLPAELGEGLRLERLQRADLSWGAPPPAGAEEAAGEARQPRRPPRRSLRRSSYSGLLRAAADQAHGGAPEVEELRDLDAAALDGPSSEATAPLDLDADLRPDGPAALQQVPLADLMAGTRLGTGLHALLERIDFRREDAWEAVAADLVRRGALPAEAARPLLDALPGLLQTPLCPEPAIRLKQLGRRDRRDELGFVLPVALRPGRGPARARGDGRGFLPSQLARLLEAHPGPDLPPGYPAALAALDAGRLSGWLSGAIDLVFRRSGAVGAVDSEAGVGAGVEVGAAVDGHVDGVGDDPPGAAGGGSRWYLLDWKSNRLGPRWEDYAPRRLAEEMARHHYVLQAQLYALALHRHLRQRVAGYDYDRHFGGAFYVFVRGVKPGQAGSGVWFGRPPKDRIAAMDRLFAEGAP